MNLPKLVGINHVALEVGDIDQALDFYSALFSFELRGRTDGAAFLDLGDQFLALMESDETSRDAHRHFGLVVDDKDRVERLLEEKGVQTLPGPFLDFLDPWGNRIQIIAYQNIQFSKTGEVLRAMGLDGLGKSEQALQELREKGMSER